MEKIAESRSYIAVTSTNRIVAEWVFVSLAMSRDSENVPCRSDAAYMFFRGCQVTLSR